MVIYENVCVYIIIIYIQVVSVHTCNLCVCVTVTRGNVYV